MYFICCLISVSRRGGRNKGGHKQIRANASERRQTRTNAEAQTQANASKREQTWTNADKCLHPPLLRFFTPPFAILLRLKTSSETGVFSRFGPFGAVAICDSNRESQITSSIEGVCAAILLRFCKRSFYSDLWEILAIWALRFESTCDLRFGALSFSV